MKQNALIYRPIISDVIEISLLNGQNSVLTKPLWNPPESSRRIGTGSFEKGGLGIVNFENVQISSRSLDLPIFQCMGNPAV